MVEPFSALASAVVGATALGIDQLKSSAESIVARSCSIEISNFHLDLELDNPSVYKYGGYEQRPPPPTILPGYKDSMQYVKTSGGATGTYGVLTYELNKVKEKDGARTFTNGGKRLTLMWGVPLSWEYYSNWFAIGIEDEDISVDHDLYDKMYNGSGNFTREKAGNSITYEEDICGIPLKITARMSEASHATILVHLK